MHVMSGGTTVRVAQPTPESLAEAAAILRAGGVVGVPTETVYGLAGSAFDPDALTRIFATKERPTFDPLIVHVAPPVESLADFQDGAGGGAWLARAGLVDADRIGPDARATADRLIAAFWPGPLTIVLPKHARVPDLATSGLPTVALRMPRHPVTRELIRLAGPLAAPSANRFGRISPTRAEHVVAELGDRIPLVLDGGPSEIGVESTVIAVGERGAVALLRPGGIARAEIERVAGVSVSLPGPSGGTGAQAAPGMLESHYAPRTPLRLLPGSVAQLAPLGPAAVGDFFGRPGGRVGLLAFSGEASDAARALSALTGGEVLARSLSRAGDPIEAARRLFAELRALDDARVDVIFAEPPPSEHGLGHAIADRLRRASIGNRSRATDAHTR